MTLSELHRILHKANILMAAGMVPGYLIGLKFELSHPILFGFLIGLLCSMHVYRQYIRVLVDEYKRLKSLNDHQDEDIS